MVRSGLASVGALAVVLLAGCAAAVQEAGVGEGAELASSLEVRVEGAVVHLALHVTNAGAEAVELEYVTAQRYDFEVWRAGGEAEWVWSWDRAFAQMLGTDRLEAGESRTYRGEWSGATAGRYVAVGRLTARGAPVALQTTFEVLH